MSESGNHAVCIVLIVRPDSDLTVKKNEGQI